MESLLEGMAWVLVMRGVEVDVDALEGAIAGVGGAGVGGTAAVPLGLSTSLPFLLGIRSLFSFSCTTH